MRSRLSTKKLNEWLPSFPNTGGESTPFGLVMGGLLAVLPVAAVYASQSGLLDKVKTWWNRWRLDTKLEKIVDRLKDDKEIVDLLQLPASAQRGKWQKLLANKLLPDEQNYINMLYKKRFQEKMTKEELDEIKAYTKEQVKKLKLEGSETGGVPGYLTPSAFTGEEGGDGAKETDFEQDQFSYSIKAPKEKKHFIKLHEASYKAFKEDANSNEIQKVNGKILEVSKMLREISRALDHSIKLKTESSLDNSTYWKRTNEAILKINARLAEVTKKARKLANINELAANSIKDKLVSFFNKANIQIKPQDVEGNKIGPDHFEFDIMINGEPHAIDFDKGNLVYQDFDKETLLGNIKQEQEVIKNITQIFKP
jgi:hypothetical protein